MASLQGLPPLPKSLSGLLNFSSSQWKEMERIHTMRTMIQQDLNRSQMYNHGVNVNETHEAGVEHGRSPPAHAKVRKTSTLDTQLALLRKEMVGLRQLDMSLLCQLWSLNESLLEYKRLLQDRLIQSMSFQSQRWDTSIDQSSCDEPDSPGPFNGQTLQEFETRRKRRSFCMVHEDISLSSSTSQSSLEFGDI
ncbi:Protein fam89a [Chamberlinius hualienensis]